MRHVSRISIPRPAQTGKIVYAKDNVAISDFAYAASSFLLYTSKIFVPLGIFYFSDRR